MSLDERHAEHIRLTYADYAALPEDGRRYEIIDGEIFVSPSPMTPHQWAATTLVRLLGNHVEEQRLGFIFSAPFDVLLSQHDIVQPDVVFVSTARRRIITRKHIKGSPDLVVEVLSASTSRRDLRDKRVLYARCGVPHYWLVDPRRKSVIELVLEGDAYAERQRATGRAVLRPLLFPRLRLTIGKLWERP